MIYIYIYKNREYTVERSPTQHDSCFYSGASQSETAEDCASGEETCSNVRLRCVICVESITRCICSNDREDVCLKSILKLHGHMMT